MRRFMLFCISAITSLTGFVLALGGVLLATSTPTGPERNTWWRVVSIGFILVGLALYPYDRNQIPDWTPNWTRRFVPIYAWFFIIVGGIIFLLSWL